MTRALNRIVQLAGTGQVFICTALTLLISGGQCQTLYGAEVEKGLPETPPGAAAVAGTYCCYDGNAYRVILTLNSNRAYWATGSSCLKNKGDASAAGTWKLAGRRIVLTRSKAAGWMTGEPKVFDTLKYQGDWIFVRADRPDFYNSHGVTDVSCFQRQAPEESYIFLSARPDGHLPRCSKGRIQRKPLV